MFWSYLEIFKYVNGHVKHIIRFHVYLSIKTNINIMICFAIIYLYIFYNTFSNIYYGAGLHGHLVDAITNRTIQ